MKEHSLSIYSCEKKFNSGKDGLNGEQVKLSAQKHGVNLLSEKKPKSL